MVNDLISLEQGWLWKALFSPGSFHGLSREFPPVAHADMMCSMDCRLRLVLDQAMLFGSKFKGFGTMLALEVRKACTGHVSASPALLRCVICIFQQLLLLQMTHNLIRRCQKYTLHSSLKPSLWYLALLLTFSFFGCYNKLLFLEQF